MNLSNVLHGISNEVRTCSPDIQGCSVPTLWECRGGNKERSCWVCGKTDTGWSWSPVAKTAGKYRQVMTFLCPFFHTSYLPTSMSPSPFSLSTSPPSLPPRVSPQENLQSPSAFVRSTVVTALKYTISDQLQPIDTLLHNCIGEFLATIGDADLVSSKRI